MASPRKEEVSLARRDEIADHLRSIGMRCFAQLSLTKVTGGATLFMENWSKGDKAVLVLVDKWGGVMTYRVTTAENSMEAEKNALTEYVGA